MHKAEEEGACSALEGKLYLSLQDGIAEVSTQGLAMRCVPFSGPGALCAGEKCLFCADHSGAIWRFDRETLMEQAVSSGGPGICDLCLSPCGTRLYALLGEADSILLSDAQSGRPMVLNRCGCNPRGLSCSEDILIAAGGESSRVYLYDAHTLECIREISMPGPVHSAVLCNGCLWALCLTADLNTLLVICHEKRQTQLRLNGMPGCLCVNEDHLFATTQGRLHVLSCETERLIHVCSAPGRASRICVSGARVFVYDPLCECVFFSWAGASWRMLHSRVHGMSLL